MPDMEDDSGADDETVTVSMEITGEYDAVVSKLQVGAHRRVDVGRVVDDMDRLLETIVRMDGGTRSAIADRLSEETAGALDAQAVVQTLRVLERYELVVLEGNTWKPGPALQA